MAFKAPSKTTSPIKLVPPNSEEAESAVLGSILMNPDSINKVVEILESDDFYSPKNKLIYEAALNLNSQNKPVDGVSLTEYFKSRNQLNNIGGIEYLGELGLDTVLSSNIEYYAQIIKENSIKRKLINAGSTIIEEVFKKADETQQRICPLCNSVMVKNSADIEFSIEIDECYTCGGVFLDNKELEEIRSQFGTEQERIEKFNNIFNKLFIEMANSENKK